MRDLVEDLEHLGCTGVTTYIQSGNAVFRKAAIQAGTFAKRIEAALADRRGIETKVRLLPARELASAIDLNPFANTSDNPKVLHVFFLARAPDTSKLQSLNHALNDAKADSESISLQGDLLFLHAPDGIGRSKLAAKVERLLGVGATSRNWRTVITLLDLTRKIP
jgi:uncharacterized protein (DUF1697 family)